MEAAPPPPPTEGFDAAAVARFMAFSKLQQAALAHGLDVPIPEIVALGGQSDGKSSLLEGAPRSRPGSVVC